jgi:cysteine sulfinate desulfinase/cysteine desulfurase-like protein
MVSVLNLPTMEKVNDYKPFCNMKLKSNLAADDVIVSIGSACNTSEKGASHVIKAMGAPFIIRCGVVRISLGDYNTESQVRQFAKKFIKACYLQ